MHTRTRHAEFRFRHKRRMQAVPFGNGLHRQFECHDIVRHLKRLAVPEIYFMLCRRFPVMGGLHRKAHLFQCQDHIPSGILPEVHGTHVKITRLFPRMGGRRTILVHIEQEKLALRTHIKAVAHIRRFLNRPFQNIPRISLKRRSVRSVNITDQPRHPALLGTPRKDRHGIQIRIQIHIRLHPAGKSLNGRTVKHTLVIQCPFKLARRHRHIFQIAEYIRKLQPDKFHILFCHKIHDILFCQILHPLLLFSILFEAGGAVIRFADRTAANSLTCLPVRLFLPAQLYLKRALLPLGIRTPLSFQIIPDLPLFVNPGFVPASAATRFL